MNTQKNDEIATEVYSLLFGICPKCRQGKLSVVPEDLEKRKLAFANNTLIFQKCDVCGYTAKI